MSYNDALNEAGVGGNLEFSDKSIRHGFIRKVYMILFVQLVVTFGFVAMFTLSEDVRMFAKQNQWLMWVSFAVVIVLVIALSCCSSLRRKTPHNFIFLGVFTVAEGFILGCVSAMYTQTEILMAVGICFAVVLALTLFAFQTKYDFTMCGGFLLVAVIILFMFGLLTMIIGGNILRIVYACAGALIFCMYLVFDTQMMMGGNHKYSISPEEYIFAALNLYLDIINIFMYLLQIIGFARD